MPAFYSDPQTIDDLVNHSVGRVLDLFDLDAGMVKRWEGNRRRSAIPSAQDLSGGNAEPRDEFGTK